MRVPFPHVERAVLVARPALVIARRPTGTDLVLLWTLMITNAARAGWTGDIDIADWQSVGLLIPSKIRTAKISAVEERAATLLGRIDATTWRAVTTMLREAVALA